MNSTNRQPTEKEQARGIWYRLTEPSDFKDSAADAEGLQRRHNARLLASLLLTLLPLGFLIVAVPTYVDPLRSIWQDNDFLALAGTLAFWAAAYGLSRIGRYEAAAKLLVGAGTLTIFAMSLGDDNSWKTTFLIIIVLLSSLFLSTWATVLLVVVHVAGLLLLPLFNSTVTLVDVVVGPLSFMLVGSTVVLLIARHRDRLERDRRAELRESEARYRALFEATFEGIAICQDGVLIDANPRLARMFGYLRSEILGLPLLTLFAETSRDWVARCAGRVQPDLVAHNIEDGAERSCEASGLRKDGTSFDAELLVKTQTYRGSTAQVVAIRDITERARTEENLKRFMKAIECSSDAIGIADIAGVPIFLNEAFIELTQYTLDQLIASGGISALYADRAAAGKILTALKSGESWSGELEIVARDGHVTPVEVRADAIQNDSGDIIGLFGTHTDITERVRIEAIRARAEEALQRRTAQLEALREVGLEVNAQLDLDDLLRSIVSRAIDLLGATEGGLELHDPDRDVLDPAVTLGPDWPHSSASLRQGEGLAGRVWETGESLIVDDYGQWEGRLAARQDRPYPAAVVGVPVRWGPPGAGEEFLGVLTVESETPSAFSPADAELLSLFATQAAIAIRNARLYQETQQQALEQETLREAALTLTTTLDRDEVIDRILARLQEVVPYDTASVQLLRRNRQGDRLEIVGGRGFPNLEDLLGVTFDPGREDNPNQEVIRSRAPFIVEDAPAVYEGFRRAPHTPARIRSWLGVPMLVGDQLIGMIALDKSEPGFYSQEHARLAEAFAAQAAVAINNAKFFEKAQRQSRRLSQTLETSELLHQGLELEWALRQIAQGAVELGFRRTVINIREPEGELVTVGATAGFEGKEREELESATYRWSGFQALFQEQFQVSRSYLVRQGAVDLEQEFQGVVVRSNIADRGPGYWRPDDMLLIPLRSAPGDPVGLLSVDDPADGLVPDLDTIRTLETFANQAALAIQNARLFEAERRQRELSQALEKAAAAVNSTLEPDQVLDRILEQVERITGGDVSNIMLVEENGLARIVRYRGYGRLGIDTAEHTVRISEYVSLAQMMKTREPIAIPDTAASSHWLNRGDEEYLRSYAGAPICARDQVVGFLNVGSVTPDFFNPAHGRTIQAFANHAATAIENARLYQELRTYAVQLERRVQERTAELQTEYARLDAILHSTADGIVVTDARGEILQTNPVAQAWLTHTLSPEEAGRLRTAVRDVVTQKSEKPVDLLELKGLDLELSGAPISEPPKDAATPDEEYISRRLGEPGRGEPAAVVAIHDVSHLRALDRMKTRFVTNISHELRTPITTIKLYTELMQRMSPGHRKWKRYLDTLTQEASHQARLVEDILQISRIDAGRLEMQPRPTPLRELTQAAIASHRPAARERGLRLKHQPAEPGPVALVDPERMKQVLDNLISNAVRYTPAGGKVTVSTETMQIQERTWATVTVSDTGIGISQDELPHIFERFFRGTEVRAKQLTGTGLGLAIVQEIVELHGGHMTVESEEGAGSAFTVWLPLISEEPDPAVSRPEHGPLETH